MAEPIKISTSKYTKQGKVEIDGHLWTVKLPGAGTEMRLSQSFRKSKGYAARIELLEKKIDDGKASETDLDTYDKVCAEYDENERFIMSVFTSIFQDDTKDNSEVKQWLEETPSGIIQMAFESIKESANGRSEPTESS